MSKAISLIKALPIKERAKIAASPKDFLIFKEDGTYFFTNDLLRYRAEYMKRKGSFIAISVIKNEL